jgi:Polyketide cyclase / dehydrase and lipid transport
MTTWSIESIREAPVEAAAVFALYAEPESWSRWGHNATWARSSGPLVEGGTVDVRANYGRVYPCRIRRLVPGRALELEVHPPLLAIVNIYEVEPTATGARIRHAFEVSGKLARATRMVGLDWMYRRQLDEEIGRVITLAEPSARKTPSSRPNPARDDRAPL